MAQVEQLEQARGNTKTLARKSRKFCFTLWKWDEDKLLELEQKFKHDKYVIGRELGRNTENVKHLQGYLEFKNPRSWKSVKEDIDPSVHLDACKGSAKQNYEYCTKEGDFVANFDCRDFKQIMKDECLKEYKDVKWHPWQQKVLDILSTKPDTRTINWFYDDIGNKGKSFLTKYIALTQDVIICEGKKADIFNQVNVSLEAKKMPKVIIMDIPRTNIEYINYGVLEQLKNGCIYSGKYEGGMCIFPHPHVICFANVMPQIDALSKDRWNINEIVTPPSHV